jgi:hypothetical protein
MLPAAGKGRRFALLSFLYGEREARLRDEKAARRNGVTAPPVVSEAPSTGRWRGSRSVGFRVSLCELTRMR